MAGAGAPAVGGCAPGTRMGVPGPTGGDCVAGTAVVLADCAGVVAGVPGMVAAAVVAGAVVGCGCKGAAVALVAVMAGDGAGADTKGLPLCCCCSGDDGVRSSAAPCSGAGPGAGAPLHVFEAPPAQAGLHWPLWTEVTTELSTTELLHMESWTPGTGMQVPLVISW